MAPRTTAHLEVEHALLEAGTTWVAGVDEVGRGALAGPVCVGVVLVDGTTGAVPHGLCDSKLVPAAERAGLVPQVLRWCAGAGVGHAHAWEVDDLGIVAALRTAGLRALHQALGGAAAGPPAGPGAVLLDGSHDWLSPPPPTLFDDLLAPSPGVTHPPDAAGGTRSPGDLAAARELAVRLMHETSAATGVPATCTAPDDVAVPRVRTRVKADVTCAAVAGASVLAKVHRDGLMERLDACAPGYGWAENKGYTSPSHVAGLVGAGPGVWHRTSWRLPGVVA